MTKNLIAIFIGLIFFITAIISKNHIFQKIGIAAAIIVITFAIMWTIGTIKDHREKKK